MENEEIIKERISFIVNAVVRRVFSASLEQEAKALQELVERGELLAYNRHNLMGLLSALDAASIALLAIRYPGRAEHFDAREAAHQAAYAVRCLCRSRVAVSALAVPVEILLDACAIR